LGGFTGKILGFWEPSPPTKRVLLENAALTKWHASGFLGLGMKTAIIAATALIALSPMASAGDQIGRPTRPENPTALEHRLDGEKVRPSITDVEDLVTRARRQKDEEREKQKPKIDELRHQVRVEITEIKSERRLKALDLLDSLQAAQEKALEQARKIRDEAKDSARERTRVRERPL